ncbi:MAG TPA: selenium cofactor biosynthesis protein YqeC [Rectinemataceae bacterium]|nr:selenium cofactor biosynthesis protein YqeC [Rectinemataceae bacterium]
MELADLVLELLGVSGSRGAGAEGRPGRGFLSAFVGAGGKTTALYALAEELAGRGERVLVSTTTKIYDPRVEGPRPLARIELAPELAPQTGPNAGSGAAASAEPAGALTAAPSGLDAARAAALDRIRALASPGKIVLLAAESLPDEGKLRGLAPEALCALAGAFDHVLVEADGARRLPVKAPGPDEPVVPLCADLVVGCVGLDCLGRNIGPGTVHRSELFAPLVGALAGEPITASRLARLAAAPEGLFKAAPPGARRLVALNKAELLPSERLEELLDFFAQEGLQAREAPRTNSERPPIADAVACCSFAAPSGRILALLRLTPHPGLRRIY